VAVFTGISIYNLFLVSGKFITEYTADLYYCVQYDFQHKFYKRSAFTYPCRFLYCFIIFFLIISIIFYRIFSSFLLYFEAKSRFPAYV